MRSRFKYSRHSEIFFQLVSSSLVPSCSILLILVLVLFPLLNRTARQNDQAHEEFLSEIAVRFFDDFQQQNSTYLNELENTEWLHDLFIQHHLGKQSISGTDRTKIIGSLGVWAAKDLSIAQTSFQFYGAENEIFTNSGICFNLEFFRSQENNKLQFYFFQGFPTLSHVTFSGKEYLLYCAPFTDIANGQKKGELNVLYDTEQLGRRFVNAVGSEILAFRILTEDNQLIWEYRAQASAKETVVLCHTSEVSAVQYEIEIPLSVHDQTILQVRPVLWWTVLLNIVFCILASIYFARKNYNPLRSILAKVIEETTEGNEYQLLDTEIDRILEELRHSKMGLDDLQPLARQRILSALLNGSLYYADVSSNQLRSCCVEFHYPQFSVLCVTLTFSQLSKSQSHGQLELLVSQCEAGLECSSYICYEEDHCQILLNYNSPEDHQKFLTAFVQECMALCGTIPPCIGIGDSITNVNNLYISADHAHIAMNYAMLKSTNMVVSYSEITGQFNNQLLYSITSELLLSQSLQSCNVDNVKSLLASIMEDNLSQRLSLPAISLLYQSVYATLLRTAQAMGISMAENAYRVPKIVDLSDAEQKLNALAEQICHLGQANQDSAPSDPDQRILDYVEQNLYDPDLSLGSIAEHFEKSPSYVSQLFKRRMDINYNDYVNRQRIHRVVELIVQKQLSFEDACSQVGYVSFSTARRNFIKFTNRTPGEFVANPICDFSL